MKATLMSALPRHAAVPLAIALVATSALAQPGPGGEAPPESSWSLGVGAISMQKPYAGTDRDNKALPVLQYENRYLNIFGPQVGVKVLNLESDDDQQLNFMLVGRYDGSGYEAKDSPRLAGMAEREGGFWAGAEVEWKNDVADLKASWLADASGNSKGRKFNLGLEKTWQVGERMLVTPRIEANWSDKKTIDYYYGVRASEAIAGRPAYVGKAGTSGELGVRGIYMFDQRHSVLVDLAVASLPSSVKNSPLVDRSSENRILMAYTYRFK